jgi:hypothetical protein
MREKVAEGRMRGQQCNDIQHFPLTLALSLRERGLFAAIAGDQF